MSHSSWLPGRRAELIEKALGWKEYFKLTDVKAKLGIPQTRLDTFEEKVEKLNAKCNYIPRGARTPTDNAEIRALEKEVVAEMSDIKMRYLFIPPLTEADFITLGLHMKDKIPTPVGVPVGMVTATVKYPNECAIELHIEHVDGTPFDRRANYGVEIKHGKGAANEPPPTTAEHLPESVFTRRKKYLFTFPQEDARKVAYFCLRYENSKGQAGQWGHIIDAIIP